MPPLSTAAIPQELKERSQWVNWDTELREDKETKVPYRPNGLHAMSNTPQTWSGFETCLRALEDGNGRTRFRGIGFVFNHDYTGTDFDNCVDPETGEITDSDVARMVSQLNSYTEYSPSRRGLHVINRASKPGARCRTGNFEMYEFDRFFTMTGDHFAGSSATIESNQDAVDAVYYEVFGDDNNDHDHEPTPLTSDNAVDKENSDLMKDSEVIKKATAASDKFLRFFYDGDTSGYSSRSEADLAMCRLLRRWCGDNRSQIHRIIRQSPHFRAKWDERRGTTTYGEMTIAKAMTGHTETYEPGESRLNRWWRSDEKKQNQEDLAALFVEEYKDQLCYSYELSRWLTYNGTYWETDVSDGRTALIQFIKEVIAMINASEPSVFTGEDAEEKLAKWNSQRDKWLAWAIKQNNAYAQDGILRIARDKAGVSLSEFDKDDWLLNCRNGTVDLKTGELLPHDPHDKITLMVSVDYKPEARYERWDHFLTEAVGRPQYVRFLQKEIGCCLTGSTANEIIIILYGSDATGKSTFYEPIMVVLGVPNSYGYSHYMGLSTLKHAQGEGNAPREDLLRLRTCRAAMCSEINADTKFDTALIKKIASGEPIVARGLYARETVEFLPRFKVILGTNYMPRIPYDDGGTYRRFKVNPFVHKIENVDTTLKTDFCENPEAKERILAWLVEGCLLWQAEGLEDVPREVERANAAYRRSQNPLSDFLEDFCILDGDAGKDDPHARLETILAKYNQNSHYYSGDWISEGVFGKYMKAAGFKGHRTTERTTRQQYVYYEGVRLKNNFELANGYGFHDLETIEEDLGLEMLARHAARYGVVVDARCGEFPLFENLKEKSIEDTCKKDIEVLQTPPVSVHHASGQVGVARVIRDVIISWRNASSDRNVTSKANRTNFVNLVAATVRRQHPELTGRDIEGEITRLEEADTEIQALLVELTDAEG
jgi:putative DNA primase/helicase